MNAFSRKPCVYVQLSSVVFSVVFTQTCSGQYFGNRPDDGTLDNLYGAPQFGDLLSPSTPPPPRSAADRRSSLIESFSDLDLFPGLPVPSRESKYNEAFLVMTRGENGRAREMFSQLVEGFETQETCDLTTVQSFAQLSRMFRNEDTKLSEEFARRAGVAAGKTSRHRNEAIGEALTVIGEVHTTAGRWESAEKILKQRVDFAKETFGNHWRTAMAWNDLAEMYSVARRPGDRDRCIESRKQSIELWTVVNDKGAQLISKDQRLLCLGKLAHDLQSAGRHEEEEQLCRSLLDQTIEAPAVERIAPLNSLGSCLIAQRRFAEAEEVLREAVLIEKTEDRSSLAAMALADLYRKTGRYREAEELYSSALSLERKLQSRNEQKWGAEAPVVQYAICKDLARACIRQEKLAESESHWREAQRLLTVLKSEFWLESQPNWRDAEILNELALIRALQGRTNDAESLRQQGYAILESLPRKDRSQKAKEHNTAGLQQGRQRQFAAAEDSFRKALNEYRQTSGPRCRECAVALKNASIAVRHQGHTREANVLQHWAANPPRTTMSARR